MKKVNFKVYGYYADLDKLALDIAGTYERQHKKNYIKVGRTVNSNSEIARFTAHSSENINLDDLKEAVRFEVSYCAPRASFEFD